MRLEQLMAERRALIELPSWDGKLVLGGIFIVGYYVLVILMVVGTNELAETKANIVRDAMLTLGPPIGIIIGALFRNTAAEERRDALRSNELQTAITTPSTVVAPVADSIVFEVEAGARRGTREGVHEALGVDPEPDGEILQ